MDLFEDVVVRELLQPLNCQFVWVYLNSSDAHSVVLDTLAFVNLKTKLFSLHFVVATVKEN